MAAAVLRFASAALAEDESLGVDHVGAWSCVLFGNPALGDERMLIAFDPSGVTSIARAHDAGLSGWVGASPWSVTDHRLSFGDPRTGRQFEADLTRSSLGGTWQSRTLVGGWWCSAAAPETLAAVPTGASPRPGAAAAGTYLPPLHPMVMATPTYPREAIRAAKEGRAVVCFVVDAEGRVLEPEVIELSDEIFRAPSLDSLARSRYGGWDDPKLLRPGCRSFIYRLDAVH